MNIINIGLIFLAGLNLGVALLIWLQNPKHKINIAFFLSVLSMSLWIIGMAMFREAADINYAQMWTWLQNFFGGMIVIFFFLFSVYFPYQKRKLKISNWVAMLISLILLFVVVFIPDFWVKKIILNEDGNNYLNNRLGIGYFNLHFFVYLLLAFKNLFEKYSDSEGYIKKLLGNVIIFTGIISLFGGIFGAVIPFILASLGPYWVGPYFSLPLIIYLSWFIFKSNQNGSVV